MGRVIADTSREGAVMPREPLQRENLQSQFGAIRQPADTEAEHDPAVARRASNAALRREAVQMRANSQASAESVQPAAQRGVASPASPLPHADKIQASFGAHDISHVQAHVGGESANEMGAEAYATGNHVVFGKEPDLHTAAHETAHVVQQRGGVHLKGGVGQEGDAYEQNADAVADRVVQGRSAEDLLGSANADKRESSTAVQQKPKPKTEDATGEQRHEQHDTAGLHAYWAIQSQIVLAAARFHEMAATVKSILGQREFDEAGGEPEAQLVVATYDNGLAMMTQLLQRVEASAGDMSGYQSFVTRDLGKLEGGFTLLGWMAGGADGFVSKHKYPTNSGERTRKMQEALFKIFEVFGRAPEDVQRDTHAIEGGTSKVEGEAIHTTLDSLFQHLRAARMDSQSDLENGHKQMIMAGHRATEARELLSNSTDAKKGNKYKAEIKKVEQEAERIGDTSPNLYMDAKSTGLYEQIAAMKKAH
ncbi:MAG: DUF4157 domain-containing protein [Kofleriaceae bacterium]